MRTAKTPRKPRKVKTWAEVEATPNGKCIIENQNILVAKLEARVREYARHVQLMEQHHKNKLSTKQRMIRLLTKELDWIYATYPEIQVQYQAVQDVKGNQNESQT